MLNICGLKLWGLGESEVEESANSYQWETQKGIHVGAFENSEHDGNSGMVTMMELTAG